MVTHADRPAGPEKMRYWRVTQHDGKQIVLPASCRASARHYSKSYRDDYVSSKSHYFDVKSVRLVRNEIREEIPF